MTLNEISWTIILGIISSILATIIYSYFIKESVESKDSLVEKKKENEPPSKQIQKDIITKTDYKKYQRQLFYLRVQSTITCILIISTFFGVKDTIENFPNTTSKAIWLHLLLMFIIILVIKHIKKEWQKLNDLKPF